MSNIVEFPDQQIIKDEAAAWLIRLDRDDPLAPDEHQQLVEWANRSPGHRRELHRLAGLWQQSNVLTELSVPLGELSPIKKPKLLNSSKFSLAAGMAATLLLAVVVGLNWPRLDGIEATNGLYVTQVGEQQLIRLADTSTVMMNTDSEIRVEHNGQFRDVFLLKGESHFTVAKDAERPFRVYAAGGRIDAIGTAFSVYLRAGAVDVTVTEGKVNLVTLEELVSNPLEKIQNGAVVTPTKLSAGQFVSLADDGAGVVSTLEARELSRKTAWTKGSLVFSGESLSEVVAEVGRYTDIKIEFSEASLGKIRVGGVFPVGETDIMFDVLESTFGLEITQAAPRRILISAARKK